MKLFPDTNSYMQLCLNIDGSDPLYLFIPTYWDETIKQHMGYVRLVKFKKIIAGRGATSKELEQSFNDNLRDYMEHPKYQEETLALFKPLSYWEEMQLC